MVFRTGRLIRHGLRAIVYSTVGATLVLLIGGVVYLDSRSDLEVWDLADLDEEFTVRSGVETFADYLELEERLFRQLDEQVYGNIPPGQRHQINRYFRGSLSDPQRWTPNWNRSFVLKADSPRAAVLLLHGMSDSPYSLRHIGRRLNAAGAYVVGLRMPGHGTAPSGLVDLSWRDMAAATRLAMQHLGELPGDVPIHIVGYSTGAALAVLYSLAAIEDASLPRAERLAVLSPAIGVTPVAALAVWQGRLGRLLGLEKLAWNAILPEYDPFKYGSFAVNAGDVVYRLTEQIQKRISGLTEKGGLGAFPPILAFSSIVDATVSTPDLIKGLFDRLPAGEHELVLFDINRSAKIEPLMKWNPDPVRQALQAVPQRTFTLSMVSNRGVQTREVLVRSTPPGDGAPTESDPGLSWPQGIYSLAHVALPFPPDDGLYGYRPAEDGTGLRLGGLALRGERGVLNISAAEMLRLRSNPFYPYVESRILKFTGLNGRHEQVKNP